MIIIIIREQCILELEQFILGITGICGSAAQLNLTQTHFLLCDNSAISVQQNSFRNANAKSPLIEIYVPFLPIPDTTV